MVRNWGIARAQLRGQRRDDQTELRRVGRRVRCWGPSWVDPRADRRGVQKGPRRAALWGPPRGLSSVGH